MFVPLGVDDRSRTIRAHEMIHAKVSPVSASIVEQFPGLSSDLLVVAEEARVNLLSKLAGFDTAHLQDGSENRLGKLIAETKDERALVTSTTVLAGSGKPFEAFVRGLASIDEGLASFARRFEKSVVKFFVDRARDEYGSRTSKKQALAFFRRTLASTRPVLVDLETREILGQGYRYVRDGEGNYKTVPLEAKEGQAIIPEGFVETLALAHYLEGFFDPDRREDFAPIVEGDEDGSIPRTESKSSPWASLKWDKSISLNRRADNTLGRTKRHSDSGIVPKRLERLLTDSDRRIFETKRRSIGGIVLVDQSGSMSLDLGDLDDLVKVSAGCVVIGYSHGHRGDGSNVWKYADRGRYASRVRSGNGGNGCDRPALDYALSIRNGDEPIVWVCDGYVTYAHDGLASKEDRLEILALVKRHRVFMAKDIAEGIEALRRALTGSRLEARFTDGLVSGIHPNEWEKVWNA